MNARDPEPNSKETQAAQAAANNAHGALFGHPRGAPALAGKVWVHLMHTMRDAYQRNASQVERCQIARKAEAAMLAFARLTWADREALFAWDAMHSRGYNQKTVDTAKAVIAAHPVIAQAVAEVESVEIERATRAAAAQKIIDANREADAPAEIMEEMARAGIVLDVDGHGHILAPAGTVLTDAQKFRLTHFKPQIVHLIHKAKAAAIEAAKPVLVA